MLRKPKREKMPPFVYHSGGGPSHLKEKRTFVARKPMHFVLRSRHGKGKLALSTAANLVELTRIVKYCQWRFQVKVHICVITDDHLHLVIKSSTRDNLRNFMRTVTALSARAVTGARRGVPFRDARGVKAKFWTGSSFSRILHTAFEEKILVSYLKGELSESTYGPDAWVDFFQSMSIPVAKALNKPVRLKLSGKAPA